MKGYCYYCNIKFNQGEGQVVLHFNIEESAHEKCFNDNNKSQVDHPGHYGGENNPYETIKVIAAWKLGFCLGNTIKYISRAGKKDPEKYIEDLEKAKFYLEYKINELKKLA